MEPLSAHPLHADETRGPKHVEVLGDRLARDRQRRGQLLDRQGAVGPQAFEDPASGGIGNGVEYVFHGLDIMQPEGCMSSSRS
jgi:hypothetical protein